MGWLFMHKDYDGGFYIIISAVSFGLLPILGKMAYTYGTNTFTVLFLRFLLASVIVLFYMFKRKVSLRINFKDFMLIIIFGVLGYSLTSLCLFQSYNYISAGLSTMILFTYPAIVTFLSMIIFKEKQGTNKLISLALSLAGVLVLSLYGSKIYNIKGIILSLLASLFYSIYVLGISHTRIKKMDNYVSSFFISVVACVFIGFIGKTAGQLYLRINFYSLVCIVLMAFISTFVALTAFLKGVKLIGATRASIISTLEPVVSLLLGIIILKEATSVYIFIGSVLIIVGASQVTRESKKISNRA